jgi:soluble epoxide hydrolase/lipid-phosphate phosphatase
MFLGRIPNVFADVSTMFATRPVFGDFGDFGDFTIVSVDLSWKYSELFSIRSHSFLSSSNFLKRNHRTKPPPPPSMPLSSLPQRQTFTSATGHTYSYIYIPTQALTKQTLLLLHGFPSHIPDWINQVSYFSTLGYGILALDLLGYGQSSQPSDVNAYRFKPMGSEIVELLNVLKLSKVVGVGHDFGAALLSRLITYNPERFEKAVFLAVGPPRPNTPFKVDEINTMTKKMLGYEMLGYIPWLASDPTSQQALERNAESAMSLMFCSDKREWDQWFHPLGKMKEFVEGGRRVSVKRWFGDELQAAHVEAFGRKDGYKGVRMWYGMWMRELFAEDEKGKIFRFLHKS